MNHIFFYFLCIIFSKTRNLRKFFPAKYTTYMVYGWLLLLQDEMELAVKELDEYKELFNERNKVSNY